MLLTSEVFVVTWELKLKW